MSEEKVKRVPVTFRWDALNWDFLKMLADIAHYATEKYGSAEQYANARLEGEKSPINHAYEHLRQYQAGEPHDHFGDPRYHLAAAAYGMMMEFLYHTRWGHKVSPLFGTGVEKKSGHIECPECGCMLLHTIGCSKDTSSL